MLGLLCRGDTLATSCVNLAEVEAGLRERERRKAEAVLGRLRFLVTTPQAAYRAGRYRAEWARTGRTIQMTDALAADTARAHGAVLVTHNTDDSPMGEVYGPKLFGTRDTWFRPTEALLADDETKSVEYKQTARWNVHEQKKDKTMEQVIAKTVAGFLNGRGGTLLIGVTDDRQPVGLDADYALVQPPNADGYVNWLDTMLENALGHAGAHRVDIRIDVIDGRDVCRLDVPASSRPIWAKTKQGNVLYERRNNSTRAIPESEARAFLRQRFGPSFDPAAEEL